MLKEGSLLKVLQLLNDRLRVTIQVGLLCLKKKNPGVYLCFLQINSSVS